QALAAYIERNRDFALDRLRSLAIDQAVPGGDLSRYVESRSLLRQIRPAQQWLVLYQEPPDELMASLLHDWLSAQGASTGTSLAPVSQVLQANRSAVGR